jgi:hypothetical protein
MATGGGERLRQKPAADAGFGLGEDQDVLWAASEPGELALPQPVGYAHDGDVFRRPRRAR